MVRGTCDGLPMRVSLIFGLKVASFIITFLVKSNKKWQFVIALKLPEKSEKKYLKYQHRHHSRKSQKD